MGYMTLKNYLIIQVIQSEISFKNEDLGYNTNIKKSG